MTLHRAVSHLGLLNASLPLPVCSPKGCRLLAMGNVLYCFYFGEGNEVMMTSRLATGAWSVPVDLKFPSLSGLPAVYAYNGRIHVFTSAEANKPITSSNGSKVLHWQPGADIRIHLDMSMNVFGSPSVAELNGKLYLFSREPGYGELRWGSRRRDLTGSVRGMSIRRGRADWHARSGTQSFVPTSGSCMFSTRVNRACR